MKTTTSQAGVAPRAKRGTAPLGPRLCLPSNPCYYFAEHVLCNRAGPRALVGTPLKLAFIILAHRQPAQLARLVQRLPADAPVVIHLDRRVEIGPFRRLLMEVSRAHPVQMARRHACTWGGFGIVAATLAGIEALIASRQDYDRAMLLSGQDYPIKSMRQTAEFLMSHAGTEFMEAFPLDAPNRWTQQAGPYQAMNRARYWHFRFRSRHVMVPIPRRFPRAMRPFGGSQWWCLTRPCIEYLDGFARSRSREFAFFKNVFIPDEMALQTVVANSPFAERIEQDDLRFADWGRPTPPYPATLRCEDMQALAASRKLFARKFDAAVDAAVFDRIDRELLA